MPDKALFTMISGGSRQAFDTVVERYVAPLNLFAIRIVGDDEAARDVVQDAFVYVWENRRKLQSADHLRNSLYLVVRNYSLNWLKRSSNSCKSEEAVDLSGEDISAEYVRAETARMLDEAIARLPRGTAQVITLSLEGLKQEEIARRLGISLATVKAQKSRGIVLLREILGPLVALFAFLR